MIVVDSSIWIDFFNAKSTVHTSRLYQALNNTRVIVADLVMTEVLQGARSEATFRLIISHFADLEHLTVVDRAVAVRAARYYRTLRDGGITVRKTIDTLIATRCIIEGLPLLYSDRDFDPFVEHFGLRSAMNNSEIN